MKQVLLTGASSELMQQTIKGLGGLNIRGISRQNRTHEFIDYVQADINNPHSLAKALEEVDLIIHAAAVTHAHSSSVYMKTNVEGTHNLIEAALAAGVKKMVYISSRTAGPNNGAYAKSKWLAENMVKERMHEWLILRPSEVFGGRSKEGINQLIKDVISKPRIICPVGLKHKMYPIHLNDAAHIMRKYIFQEEASAKTITVNGAEGFSFYELIEYISHALDKKVKIIPVPRFVMYAIMHILKITGIKTSVVADQIPRLYGPKTMEVPEGKLISLKEYLNS